MKINIVNIARPILKPGQLWRYNKNKNIYLCVNTPGGTGLTLINTDGFMSFWSTGKGFNNYEREFDYIGNLVVTDD